MRSDEKLEIHLKSGGAGSLTVRDQQVRRDIDLPRQRFEPQNLKIHLIQKLIHIILGPWLLIFIYDGWNDLFTHL